MRISFVKHIVSEGKVEALTHQGGISDKTNVVRRKTLINQCCKRVIHDVNDTSRWSSNSDIKNT